MSFLKCPHCGNEKNFYREMHMTSKIKVNKHGKTLKRIYGVQQGELYQPIHCGKCNEIVVEDGDSY